MHESTRSCSGLRSTFGDSSASTTSAHSNGNAVLMVLWPHWCPRWTELFDRCCNGLTRSFMEQLRYFLVLLLKLYDLYETHLFERSLSTFELVVSVLPYFFWIEIGCKKWIQIHLYVAVEKTGLESRKNHCTKIFMRQTHIFTELNF